MGEYVMTTVTIGGVLKGQGAVEALIAAATAYFADADLDVRDALTRGTSLTLEALQNFGNTPDLDAFCRTHGLTWHRAWVARVGQFGAGLEYWRPGLERPVEEAADEAGAPMMTWAALRRWHQGGQTLAELIDHLGQADAATVPPLSLAADSA
ncbi:hypothetical protein SAMN05192565_11187 [Methylobacterium gossipiicola]|uniref:Uncharacterized protein n=2 Tax=Methylobacterium gossipiicola TaxID=582675 RepID=A0A1I2UQ39_9HYPH|nr:hypothetical protein SAMN05192565_11187 [Methylobacterium gossipiicola]